jgi:hypothetical protein
MKILIALACLVALPYSAAATTVNAQCGGAEFTVVAEGGGHPLANKYMLYGARPDAHGAKKLLLKGEEGGWFYAACVDSAGSTAKPWLLVQSYCGGSACVEDRYSIIDPRALKVVLKPKRGNVPNTSDASKFLGKEVPYLPNSGTAFCCEAKR